MDVRLKRAYEPPERSDAYRLPINRIWPHGVSKGQAHLDAWAREPGPEHVMLEAADPDVVTWYIRNYGIDINLFVEYSQIVQLECLSAGLWGTDDNWGRMLSYRGASMDEGR